MKFLEEYLKGFLEQFHEESQYKFLNKPLENFVKVRFYERSAGIILKHYVQDFGIQFLKVFLEKIPEKFPKKKKHEIFFERNPMSIF